MIDEMNSAAKVPLAGSYKLVVFDWDGTILDTTAAIAISIQYAAEKMGLPVPSATKARSVIGLGWRDAMKIIAPTCPEEEFPQFGAYYVERYRPEEGKVHLFPGIENVIRTLHERGVTLAIATGKSRRGLNRVLEATGLGKYFTDTETADENPSKPDPGMLEAIGIATGIEPADTIMVGDTTHDLGMANAWGCRSIGMTYGAMTAEMLEAEKPVALCRDAEELARVLGLH